MNLRCHISLRKKAVSIIAAMAITLSAAAIFLSYKSYSEDMEKYYLDQAYNGANTIMALVDADVVTDYATQVMDLYYKYRDLGMTEEYLHKFDEIRNKPAYLKIEDMMNKYKKMNNLTYLYIYAPDMQTKRIVYIFDADNVKGSGAQLGSWDPFDNEVDVSGSAANGTPAVISYVEPYGWLCSVGVPISNHEGETICGVGVDISVEKMVMEKRVFLFRLVMTQVQIIILICIVGFFLMNYGVVVPVRDLTKAVSGYVDERKKSSTSSAELALRKLSIRTNDELEVLCRAVQKMEMDLSQYEEELAAVTKDRERIGAELSVAAKIQASMLPCIFPPFPERKEFDLYAIMDPAKEVGGDFYDFFLVDQDHLALVIADVSGKGVGASLFMVITKTLIKNRALAGESPKTILEKVNNQLCENNDASMFVTVWVGIYEISTGKLTASNAGHEYPVVRHKDGAFELYKDRHGFVVAGMEDVRYTEYEMQLDPGDVLLVYTDGVAEATNMEENLYGTGRLLEVLNQDPDLEPREMLSAVRADIDGFVGEAPQFDDITMLCLKVEA